MSTNSPSPLLFEHLWVVLCELVVVWNQLSIGVTSQAKFEFRKRHLGRRVPIETSWVGGVYCKVALGAI